MDTDTAPDESQDGRTTFSLDDPQDEGDAQSGRWRFDPENLPDEFTVDMVRKMTGREMKRLADPENGLLNERQQESFDAAYAEVTRELRETVGVALSSMFPRIDALGAITSRMQEQVSALGKASAAATKWETPGLAQMKKLQEEQEQRRAEMDERMEEIAEHQRLKEQRAEAQALATLDIAEGQERLRELQMESIEWAARQAAATAEVANAQVAMLSVIHEELAVLKQQGEGQRQLIYSGWTSAVVMEWTLFVAVLAAVSTILFGVADHERFSWHLWTGLVAVPVISGVALSISQRRRKPIHLVETDQ